jgi:radical SAM protein with 4Fe4S-binding SPASM domain
MKISHLFERARAENALNAVLFELTYACNLDCTFCYNDLGLRGRRVSLELYKSLLDELAQMNVLYLALSGGEPLMYQHFFELGAHARERGFVIKVKSNGVPLNRGNAQRLKEEVEPFLVELSLHGAGPESHDRLTQAPGSFDRLMRNIGHLQERDIRLKLNSTLTRWNEGEVGEMFSLAGSLGIPIEFDPEVSPRDNGDMSPLEIRPSAEGIENMIRHSMAQARSRGDGDKISLFVKPTVATAPEQAGRRKACGAASTSVTIDPFGNVLPCVQFRRVLGNIHHQSIREIWEGSEEVETVRELAGRAFDTAKAQGLKQICMGLNELHTGDPLKSPDTKLEINRIFERVTWEARQDRDVA